MRAQSYTLEAVATGIVVVTAVVFAISATAVTPLSASTANQYIETQQRSLADTALAHARENESLRPTILRWDAANRTFVNATQDGYVPDPPPTRFGRTLERTFGDRRVAANVDIEYASGDGGREAEQLVFQGTPTDDAVVATTTVVVHDHDRLTAPDDDRRLENVSAFYAPDAAPNGSVYNVLEVRIVAWRL